MVNIVVGTLILRSKEICESNRVCDIKLIKNVYHFFGKAIIRIMPIKKLTILNKMSGRHTYTPHCIDRCEIDFVKCRRYVYDGHLVIDFVRGVFANFIYPQNERIKRFTLPAF